MQPRESVNLQLAGLLSFVAHLGLPAGAKGMWGPEDLERAVIPRLLTEYRGKFGPDVPYQENPAKQAAFFALYGIPFTGAGEVPAFDIWEGKHVPTVVTDSWNMGVGHELRTQLHERSKIPAGFYYAPEFLHNLVESQRSAAESARMGLDADRTVTLYLRSRDENPRITRRMDETIGRVFEGRAKYLEFNAPGSTAYERALLTTQFGAHMSTYLAILNGADPLPVPTMSWMKNVMQGIERDDKPQERRRSLFSMHAP